MSDDKKIALVTGGCRGIGKAVVKGLAEKGCVVIATARDQAGGERSLSDIQGAIDVARLDVTSEADFDRLKHYADEKYGRLDILINNAGIAIDQWVSALEVDLSAVRETFETNLFGVIYACQTFIPMMQKAGYGRVVNVSSELGSLAKMEMAGTLAYRASKTALNAVTRLMALEVKDHADLKINAACPGWVKTDLGGAEAPRTTEEGADTIVWLALLDEDGPSGGLFRDRAPYPW